ncbi:hypothetical protein VNF293_12200 [Atlantibacter hermannii]
MPIGFTGPGSGIAVEELQASNKVHFTRIRIGIGTMLSTIAGETRFGVFEPRAFVVVLRMALQRATAEVAGIAIIRGYLRGTCTVQTTVTFESEKGFGKHILDPASQHAGISRP